MKSRTHVLTVAMTLLAITMLTACGGTTTDAAPAAPTDVTVTPGAGHVSIAWSHDGRGATGFRITRDTAGPASVAAAASVSFDVPADARSYRDTTVPVGVTSSWTVRTLGTTGPSEAATHAGEGILAADCSTFGNIIAIPDPNLETAVRDALALPTADLTCTDMAALTTLDAAGQGIEDLYGLQHANNLATADLTGNGIVDVTPLAGLAQLQGLVLTDNAIEDISALEGLTGLGYLFVSENPLDGIDAVANLSGLTYFGAARTAITSIDAIADLDELVYVWLNGAREIDDFAPLATLDAVEGILVGDTGFDDQDMSLLGGLTNLTRLQLWGNPGVTDLSVLENLNLEVELDIGSTGVTDLTPIHHMTDLRQLRIHWLGLDDASIAFLSGFTLLDTLYLDGNELTGLQALVDNTGIGDGDVVHVEENLLDPSDPDVMAQIDALESSGVDLTYEPQRVPEAGAR